MASKPNVIAGSASQKPPARGRDAKAAHPGSTTREAVREIVRRYRETFERLGR